MFEHELGDLALVLFVVEGGVSHQHIHVARLEAQFFRKYLLEELFERLALTRKVNHTSLDRLMHVQVVHVGAL